MNAPNSGGSEPSNASELDKQGESKSDEKEPEVGEKTTTKER